MKGLHLRSLRLDLHKIEHDSETPATTIVDPEARLGSLIKEIRDCFGDNFDFRKSYHLLPLGVLARFSFDELCKLKYSSYIMMHSTVTKLFETDAQYEVVRKIESSMWRWSSSSGTWNEVVDAYENMRNFTFAEDKDFELRLDYTTGYNEYGYSKYSRTYIDGVFAFLVYYRGQHVMTIGFSILHDRHILVQQVQLVQRAGNRWLYRLPSNRLEFVLDLFSRNFSGYRLSVIDGRSLAEKTIRGYQKVLVHTEESCKEQRARTDRSETYLRESEEHALNLKRNIAHLEADTERLASLYRDGGRYKIGPDCQDFNGLRHYAVTM